MGFLATSAGRTFRDPQGSLWRNEDRILREVYPQYAEPVLAWLGSPIALRWMGEGRLVPTTILEAEPGAPLFLQHERIFFPSYPWEWTPGQWIQAASLTLDLCEEGLEQGYILKDATPLNVLFSGSKAVFVDVLSFERRDPNNPLWIAYAQFVRTFLLPLAAHTFLGWPLSATMQRRDGLEPSDLDRYLPLLRRWRSPFRSLVTLPLLLEKKGQSGIAHPPHASEAFSLFAVRRLLRTTRSLLRATTPPQRPSRWSGYTQSAHHYASADHQAKAEFVRTTLDRIQPARVLDVGANTGVFSRIAAESGAQVVAWDTDLQATDLNWKAARSADLQILPLVADFARPTPPVGWRNGESSSLLDRARGHFDCVLMLGILHHLLISDQIPLPAICDQLAEITTRWAIIEWIPRGDSQFDGLCRGRQNLYCHLSEEYFVQTFAHRFSVQDRHSLSNGRTLWLIERTP